jgi:hypothetical protein
LVFILGLPGQPPGFDLLILFAGIALLLLSRSLRIGNRDKSRIDDQTAMGLKTLGIEVCLKHLEERFDHSRLMVSLYEKVAMVVSGMLSSQQARQTP